MRRRGKRFTPGSRTAAGDAPTTRHYETLRTALFFPGLRRFVYLVRMGAGRRAELMYVTTGITSICR